MVIKRRDLNFINRFKTDLESKKWLNFKNFKRDERIKW